LAQEPAVGQVYRKLGHVEVTRVSHRRHLGTAGVTTTTGFPIAANTPVSVPTTGSEPLSLFAVVASSTATVSVIYPS
jgi:hypothetical protein